MDYTEDILLNINLVREHKKDFLVYLYMLVQSGFRCDMHDSMYYCDNILNTTNRDIANFTGLTINTVRRYTKTYSNYYDYAGSIAPLPRNIWDKLINDTLTLTAAEKNGIIRTFCYFVCMSWSYQDFSRSQTLIAKELDNKVADVIRRIHWLVEHGFIYIKHHQTHFAGQESKSCVYQLYIDEVPQNYIHTKWWAFHLAERESQSVDDILANYKNSF